MKKEIYIALPARAQVLFGKVSGAERLNFYVKIVPHGSN